MSIQKYNPHFYEETLLLLLNDVTGQLIEDMTSHITSLGPSVGYVVSTQMQDELAHALDKLVTDTCRHRLANAGGGEEEDTYNFAAVELVQGKKQATRTDPYVADFDPLLSAMRRVYAKEMASTQRHYSLTGNQLQLAHSMEELVTDVYKYRLANAGAGAGEGDDSRNDVTMADSNSNESRSISKNDPVNMPQKKSKKKLTFPHKKHTKLAIVEYVPEKKFDPYLFAMRREYAKKKANTRFDAVMEKIIQ